MGEFKIEKYFQDAYKEYKKILKDVKSHLNETSADEVIAFIDHQTEQAMDKVWNELSYRYEALNEVEDALPKHPTREDQQQYIRAFLI